MENSGAHQYMQQQAQIFSILRLAINQAFQFRVFSCYPTFRVILESILESILQAYMVISRLKQKVGKKSIKIGRRQISSIQPFKQSVKNSGKITNRSSVEQKFSEVMYTVNQL
eukprot:TRINITY_DN6967_c1_g1_i4.p3 TRINITY_DN6967_c1_g1~~TRINITY_DN6967_c1_g1_i4.p3  ORF type:complete len:113 (-),score=3.94 TRINITY_DN6967_c1_g1_i4:739-1077(-)